MAKFEIALPPASYRARAPVGMIANLFRSRPQPKLVLLQETPRRRTIMNHIGEYYSVSFPTTLSIWLEPLSLWQNTNATIIPYFLAFLKTPIPEQGCLTSDIKIVFPNMPNVVSAGGNICFGTMTAKILRGDLHPHTAFWNSTFDAIPDQNKINELITQNWRTLEWFVYHFLKYKEHHSPTIKFHKPYMYTLYTPHVVPYVGS